MSENQNKRITLLVKAGQSKPVEVRALVAAAASAQQRALDVLSALAGHELVDFDYMCTIRGATRSTYMGALIVRGVKLSLAFSTDSMASTAQVDKAWVDALTTYGALVVREEPASEQPASEWLATSGKRSPAEAAIA